MAWVAAADFSFSEGRYTMRWPDGSAMPCLISMVDDKPYVTISIMGVPFYADPVKNGFHVEVPDAPPAEDPDKEHQIEDDPSQPPAPPPAEPPLEPLPGPALQPGDEVVPVAKG
jgi:hypothetical protein